MSKSILVIDTPDSCHDCKLMFIDTYSHYCGATQRDVYDYDLDRIIPDWCPLRLMPRLRPIYPGDYGATEYEVRGYNQCVKEILEE